MLINQAILEKIKSGKVNLIFRKWERPRVKKGSIIRTSIGQLEIEDILAVDKTQVDHSDAVLAGFTSLGELLDNLETRSVGTLYKIKVQYHSPDPRIQLRNQKVIPEEELGKLLTKLRKMDKSSRMGPWVEETMKTIRENPETRSADLADHLEKPKDWLKVNIRKLKNLGLTISHETGYSLSARGEVVLKQLLKPN